MKIISFDQVSDQLSALAIWKNKIAEKEVAMNKTIDAVKKRFDKQTRDLREEIKSAEEDIEAFCLKNKGDFEKARSKDFPHGIIGFRNNPPKVEVVNRKYTLKTAIELIKRVYEQKYLRVKEELNKDEILADYANKKIDDSALAGVGLRVNQDESFYIDTIAESLADSQ